MGKGFGIAIFMAAVLSLTGCTPAEVDNDKSSADKADRQSLGSDADSPTPTKTRVGTGETSDGPPDRPTSASSPSDNSDPHVLATEACSTLQRNGFVADGAVAALDSAAASASRAATLDKQWKPLADTVDKARSDYKAMPDTSANTDEFSNDLDALTRECRAIGVALFGD